jgi:hypothetical protein
LERQFRLLAPSLPQHTALARSLSSFFFSYCINLLSLKIACSVYSVFFGSVSRRIDSHFFRLFVLNYDFHKIFIRFSGLARLKRPAYSENLMKIAVQGNIKFLFQS